MRQDATDREVRAAPLIVLTYPHSGAERLAGLLAQHPDLACTAGTGILPLCEQAAGAWRVADDRSSGPLSGLAEASIRSMITSILTALLVREGKRRWCEIATASPDTAKTFVQLFPGTRIVCLYRACPEVIRAALRASPWGLAGPAYAPFTSAYPASTAAALTAYWNAHTASLLAFEQAHPAICQRLRYEDLTGDGGPDLFACLGIDDPGPGPQEAWSSDDTAATPAASTAASDAAGSDAAGSGEAFPAAQVPRPLLEQAGRLMERLGYPPLPGRG
jgi:hypothetical protein